MAKLHLDLAVNLLVVVSEDKLQVDSEVKLQVALVLLKQLVDSVPKHLVVLVLRQHKDSDRLQVWVLV